MNQTAYCMCTMCAEVALLMSRLTSSTISKDGRIVSIDDTWHEKATCLRVGLLLQINESFTQFMQFRNRYIKMKRLTLTFSCVAVFVFCTF